MRFLPALLLLLSAGVAQADFGLSPGDLAQPHANLSGITNCTRCHVVGGKLSQENCLACHTELKPEIAEGRGYHGRIPATARACEQCHHEHQGLEFKLIDWGTHGMKAFPHQQTGWPLIGKHATLDCATCHQPKFIKDPIAVALLKKFPERKTLLGPRRNCDNCHFDEHRGQIREPCASCHKEPSFTPAVLFNHDKTNYPLRGMHAKVSCIKCHRKEEDPETPPDAYPKPHSSMFSKYAPIPHKACIDCHEDFHKGAFGHRCENCHVVEGWSIVHNGPADRQFHDKTKFPLRGAHTTVDCHACHGPFPNEPARFKGLPYEHCSDCHADAHEGQMKKLSGEADPPGCERCHVVEDFIPARFDLKDHQATAYPLAGAHQAVPCSDCHVPDPKISARISPLMITLLKGRHRPELFSLSRFGFEGALDRCETCHADPHAGQFTLKDGRPKACSGCHVVAAWSTLPQFDHDRDTRYPLVGKHKSAPCAGCHVPELLNGVRLVRYRPLDTACAHCHNDTHVGQFAPSPGRATECERCHTPEKFQPATLFKHEPPFTDYLLEGEHATVKCDACHPSFPVARGVKATRYKPLPHECQDCHADFHKGAFRGFQP